LNIKRYSRLFGFRKTPPSRAVDARKPQGRGAPLAIFPLTGEGGTPILLSENMQMIINSMFTPIAAQAVPLRRIEAIRAKAGMRRSDNSKRRSLST